MAQDDRIYDPGLRAGAQIGTTNIQNAAITGAKTSLSNYYAEIGVGVTGTTVINVFGSSTAPTTGTITSFGLQSGGVAGTVTLYGTTMGTIGYVAGTATLGVYIGTQIIVGSVTAGDTVNLTPTAGSQTAFITFQTAA